MRISDWSSDRVLFRSPRCPVAHHLGKRRAAQPAARCEQRDRLQYVRLAGAIIAVKRNEPRPGAQIRAGVIAKIGQRSEEHTSELQSLMRISYAVFCLKNKILTTTTTINLHIKTE